MFKSSFGKGTWPVSKRRPLENWSLVKVSDDPEEAADDLGEGAVSVVHQLSVPAKSDMDHQVTLQWLKAMSPAAAHNIAEH